jgi:hypothetical protein
VFAKPSEQGVKTRTHRLPGTFSCTFFLFCALVLFPPQWLSVIVDVSGGSLIHLPRWRAAVEEKMPVDATLEEDEVQCNDKRVMFDIGICRCTA